MLDAAVSLVAQTLGVELCKVLELLPDGRAFLLQAGVGWQEGLVGHARVEAGTDSQAGYVLLSREPVIVADVRRETRFRIPSLLRDHGVVSGMSVIIAGRERPFGVLSAHSTRRRTFSQDDIHFLQAMANILAMAIERKQTERDLAQTASQLQAIFRALPDLYFRLDSDGTILDYAAGRPADL